MTLIAEHPVSLEWQTSTLAKMRDAGLSMSSLAKAVGTSQAAISYVLTRARGSMLVPRIDAALAVRPTPEPTTRHSPELIAEVAVLREAKDAIGADIVRLETVRSTVEERLAEAYEHRAQIEIRIRKLRGTQ